MSGPDLSCLHDDCYTQDQMDEAVADARNAALDEAMSIGSKWIVDYSARWVQRKYEREVTKKLVALKVKA